MEAVLVVGSTGNIGVSAVIGALRSKKQVLAIVRNKAAGEKLFQHVGTSENIILVEADIISDDGVQKVVQKVKDGKLPAFQHVFTSVGGMIEQQQLHNIDLNEFQRVFEISFMANYYAYRATMPYLLEQDSSDSTFTTCPGAGGDSGAYGVVSIAQGALFSMANVICLEHHNVRFNEIYLNHRVEYDSFCEGEENKWKMKASDFARVYKAILANPDMRDCRVTVQGPDDIDELKYEKKHSASTASKFTFKF